MKTLLLIALLSLLPVSFLHAFREPPKEVKPVRYNGMVIKAPHFASELKGKHPGKGVNGGFVEAYESKSGKLICSVKIYDVEYKEGVESDIFDVYITEMHLVPKLGLLLVRDERGRTFALSLKSQSVTQIEE